MDELLRFVFPFSVFPFVSAGGSGRKGSFRNEDGVCPHQSHDLRLISSDLSISSDLARRTSSGSSRGRPSTSTSRELLLFPARSTDQLNLGGGGEVGEGWSQPGSKDPMALTRARIDGARVYARVCTRRSSFKAKTTQKMFGVWLPGGPNTKIIKATRSRRCSGTLCPSSSSPRTYRSASGPPHPTASACAWPPAGTPRTPAG